MSNYTQIFLRELLTMKKAYKAGIADFKHEEWKQVFDDDILYEMLQVFGEAVIEYGEKSVYGTEIEYRHDVKELINMFVNLYAPLYNTNIKLSKALEEITSKSAKPFILPDMKTGYPVELVDKHLFDLA